MSKELRQITTSRKSFIKDPKGFVENIKDEKLSDDEQFVGFDIKGMYPSIPKYDALLEIKNKINDNKFVTSIDKRARGSHCRCSLRKAVLRNFGKFAGKH